MKVLAFGEILWDIIEGEEHLGGAPFNFAAHAAQCGNETFIISRLGSDYLGMGAYNRSKAHGVDVSYIQWDEVYPTGMVDVKLTNGQPSYTIRQNAAYDFISANIVPVLKRQVFDVFYFGSLAQRNAVSATTLKAILESNQFDHVFYDVNLRTDCFNEEIIRNSLKMCTILKLNNDEVPVISEMLASAPMSGEEFCKYAKMLYPNINIIIITASEKGCFVYSENDYLYVPGTPVKVIDAVGAGDAFSASFMHIYASTGKALLAAQIANQVGAFVATRSGAIPEYSYSIKNILFRNSRRLTNTSSHGIL